MQPSLNLIPTIQQAITSLLTTYEPEFLRFGYSLFLAFATILIAWQGIKMMFSHDGLGEQMFDFAKLLLFISFGYAFIAFYEAPLPGIGVSFSNLITDQAHYFQSRARSARVRQHLPPLRRAVRPLHAAGPVVDSGEPDLLDRAAADRLREGGLAGRDRVRPDRQRGLRAARADLRAVLHRARSSTGCSGAG